MRKKKHKRKESFSILMISNTGGRSKGYHVSKFALRLAAVLLILVCVVAAGLSCWALRIIMGQGSLLQKQAASQEQLTTQLKEENERLSNELASLHEQLVPEGDEEPAGEAETADAAQQEEENQIDEEHPDRFPSSGVASVVSSYSQETPYMSFGMQTGDSIIATQSGTVTGISSDETYPRIIEMEHSGGYRTRYMCSQEAELKVQEGEQVEAGAELLAISLENTQLDYQVFLNDEPIDPITIIDAKG